MTNQSSASAAPGADDGEGADRGRPPSQALSELRSELATLGRVSHRLAMTDAGPPLEKVLNVLLPRLLRRVGNNDDGRRENRRRRGDRKRKSPDDDDAAREEVDGAHGAVHGKLVEILGHVMKRARGDREMRLPCAAIAELLPPTEDGGAAEANPFLVNLGLAFLTLGINRCSPAECAELLPRLLKFAGSLYDRREDGGGGTMVGVGHLLDPSTRMRHDQAWHLVLRCLESASRNPAGDAASSRVAPGGTPGGPSGNAAGTAPAASLCNTGRVLASDPILAAAVFDLLADVLLYSPVPVSSTLVPGGLSTEGYRRLAGGAASERAPTGCKGWKEEFVTSAGLRALKLRMLDLVAPCRRHAIFLGESTSERDARKRASTEGGEDEPASEASVRPASTGGGGGDEPVSEANSARPAPGPVGEPASSSFDGMGASRTVALMVLSTGDVDVEVRGRAESYLRAHMDTYRGKEAPTTGTAPAGPAGGQDATRQADVRDALLGNSAALARTLMAMAAGGAAALSAEKSLLSQYDNVAAARTLGSQLGLRYSSDSNDVDVRKALLSCHRTKASERVAAASVRFTARMLDKDPRLLRAAEGPASDVAAVALGTLGLAVANDAHRPGSSSSVAMGAASSLLNSLCVRLSLFYDAQCRSVETMGTFDARPDRVRSLLERSTARACAVLEPASSGGATKNDGTRASTIQIEVRDSCYGALCSLARSRLALDDGCTLFDCGVPGERRLGLAGTSTSTAALLFGCVSNEADALRPRATSALDALLGAYVRLVKSLRKSETPEQEQESAAAAAANPWASGPVTEDTDKGDRGSAIDPLGGLSRQLVPLLWGAARGARHRSSRLAAARWSGELLLLLNDAAARHLLCFLSGDDDAAVSAAARHALGADGALGNDTAMLTAPGGSALDIDAAGFGATRASFGALMSIIVGRGPTDAGTRPQFFRFGARSQAATIGFLLRSLFSEESFYGDEDDGGSAICEFVLTILRTLARHGGRSLTRDEADLVDQCSVALAACASTSAEARLVVVKHEGVDYGHGDISSQALASDSSKTRRHLAEVMGHLYEDRSLWGEQPAAGGSSVSAWIETTGLGGVAQNCGRKLATMFQSSFSVGEVHGAASLGSSAVRAFRLAVAQKAESDGELDLIADCWEHCCSIVTSLGKGLSHSDVSIANACSRGLDVAFSYRGRDAPVLDPKLFDAVATCMGAMITALKKFSSIDHADPPRVASLVRAAGLLLAASTSGAGHAGSSVGEDAGSGPADLGPARLQCVEALFGILGSAAYRKDDELSLAVGEALASYADAWGAGEWSSGSDSAWKEGPYEESFAFELPPHRHVLYTLFRRETSSSNPLKKNSCAAALLALVGRASHEANSHPPSRTRAFVREVWKCIDSFHDSFIKLLADPKSKQLSRESCCRGLVACRGLAAVMASSSETGDLPQNEIESLNDKLLKVFGQTTNYGGSMMQETDAQARERRSEADGANDPGGQEAQVGGAAGMSEASLGAYREMAGAALSLGQVDVLYSLMMLSTNHPMWLTPEMRDRYGAKALLGRAEGVGVEEIRVSLRPHMGKLVPKLLRACNDPNKQTREQMNNLWLALGGGGAEGRSIVTQNLLPTMDVLIEDAGSKLWRARVGACGALADVIVGRNWEDLGGGGIELDDEGSRMKPTASIRLLRLWRITMRALDDVRTAVRERGEILGRGLRALTIRLCDPTAADNNAQESDVYLSQSQIKSREKSRQITAEYAVTVSLGWLVKYGLNQPCAEATGICISCLLGIVDVAKPSTLQPVLSELTGSLLMAMSGLEPSALNYLQVRAAGNDANSQGSTGQDRYDSLERLRINAASSGPIAGALQKCLDMVKFVDLDAQKKLIPELDSSLRKGAGFATRAATADAVGQLCSTCPAAFSYPGSSLSNPTVRLLRALYFASERERGATAKDKMTHALGSLAQLAPGKAVRILALKACERYCESSGSNNDPSVRKAAAATIRAIAVRASDHLQDGGPKDIWCKKVLPTAFLGRHDKDTKVSSLWKDVWDEGGAAVSSADQDGMYGVLLQEKLLPHIASATVNALQSTSWANRKAGCAVLFELTQANVLAPAPRSAGDGSQFSHEDIDRLRQRAKSSSILLSECLMLISRNRVWDGKGDAVKAGTAIAGKWSATAPIDGKSTELSELWPIVLLSDTNNGDLIRGDGWFVSCHKPNIDDEEAGCDDINATAAEEEEGNSESDTALDLSGEKDLADEEELDRNENERRGVQEYHGPQPVIFGGFCRVLLDQALRKESNSSTEGVLPYKASALSGLTALLKSVIPGGDPKTANGQALHHQKFIYDLLAPNLFSFIVRNQSSKEKSVPPLLVARALESLAAAMYNGVGAGTGGEQFSDAVALLKFFSLSTGATQPAWTVRQMSALAASSLVTTMPSKTLQKNEVITTILECSSQTLKDKKFWKVRLSGLELLFSLVNRVGKQKISSSDPEKQLIMEAILPYKEKIIDFARRSLADNESQVTSAASKITLAMAWWP